MRFLFSKDRKTFNEGYLSARPDRAIRGELCVEAIRLTTMLAGARSARILKLCAAGVDASAWGQGLLGELHRRAGAIGEARYHLERAVASAPTEAERKLLKRRLELMPEK